jgi:photosystem II stability/assembly factor-like uncharacterized protein
MNKIIQLFLILVATISFGQTKNTSTKIYKKMMEDKSIKVQTVCDSADAYFKGREKGKGTGYNPYMRWKYTNERRYGASGNRLVDEMLPYKEYERLRKELDSKSRSSPQNGTGWQSLGPDNITNITGHYAAGMGMVVFAEINKINNQEIYLGSASGGLWRTSNGGNTWSHETDFLPGSGVNAIAANPSNFNSVLINVRNVSGTSFGIYSSVDGGTTFVPTNFVPANINAGGLGSTFKVNVIQYHPTLPNLVFVGTTQGMYRSTDNMQTWSRQIITGNISEIDFHPTNQDIIYINENSLAVNKNKVLKSIDLGLTYSPMVDLIGNLDATIKISVASSCPDCVFVSSNNGVWKSLDSGLTFNALLNPAPFGVSLGYTMPNDLDETKFVGGDQDMYRSVNSAASFNKCTYWNLPDTNGIGNLQQRFNTATNYVHADLRFLDCVNGVFYAGTDGYLCKSNDNGATWQKLSLTVGIRENYCVGVSQSNNAVAICGSQDNGISIKSETGWDEAYGADGMEGIIMPLNPKLMIGSTQEGSRKRFFDGTGNSYDSVTPPGQVGAWVAPMVFDPNNQLTVYSFGKKVHKSINFGNTWSDLGAPATFLNEVIQEAAIAENNSDKIVAVRYNKIELSNDGGVTFTNIKNNLPSNLYISDVTFDPNNDDTIFVTYSDVSSSFGLNKVFVSTNSGASWTNITYNLGFMPVHNVLVANDIIYIGAEMGVYYKTLTGTSWTLLHTNLPNVATRDLEVNYGANTIKSATYGRGLWETKLVGRENFPAIVSTEITTPPTLWLPMTSVLQFVTSKIEYTGTLTNVFVSWSTGTPIFNAVNVIPMTLISGNTWKSSTALPDFPVGTKVFFKVTATGSAADTSETYKFMYDVKPLEYCPATANVDGSTYIKRFRCANLDNNNTGDNQYTYYNTNAIVLNKGSNYNAIANFGYIFSGGTDFYAWIDYNGDLDFSDNERVVNLPNITSIVPPQQVSASFIVPNDAVVGFTRMRIRAAYFGSSVNSCGANLGEVEDYLVEIKSSVLSNADFVSNQNINLYPNPVSNELTIEVDNNSEEINYEIYNLLNQLISKGNFTNKTTINTSSFSSGTYLIKLNYNKTREVRKLIKK